jgi:hypothetical protein
VALDLIWVGRRCVKCLKWIRLIRDLTFVGYLNKIVEENYSGLIFLIPAFEIFIALVTISIPHTTEINVDFEITRLTAIFLG